MIQPACETKLTADDADLLGCHLAEEVQAQQEVLRRLGEQERLLVAHDVDGLHRFLLDGDPLLARLQALTEMRIRITSLLGRRLGVPAEAVSVTRVLASVTPDVRGRIEREAAALRKLLAEVERRTRRVNVLLHSAADTNQALLHALLGEQAPLRPYRADGRRTPSSGLPHFAREL